MISRRIMWLTVLMMLTTYAQAEPIVILDEGGVPTAGYLRNLQPAEVPDFGGQWVTEHLPIIQSNPENTRLWLPLITRMTPLTPIEGREVSFALDAPICIVGSDALSQRWVTENLSRLVAVKARCWLVQADDFQSFSRMSQLFKGRVLMMPADGDAIADFFGIEHYPVVIDERLIAQ